MSEASSPLRDRVRRTFALGPAIRLIWESAPRWTVLNGVLVVAQAALPLAVLYLTKLVVDAIVAGAGSGGGPGFVEVVGLIALLAAAGLAASVAGTVTGLASEAQGQRITDHVLDVIHGKSVEVDLSYYENPTYYDTLHRAQLEAPQRPSQVLNSLVSLSRSGLTLVGVLGLLLAVHWLLPVVLLLAVLPGFAASVRNSDRRFRWQKRRAEDERLASYLDRLLVHSRSAKEIRIFGLGPLLGERFRKTREELCDERIELAKRQSVESVIGQVVTALVVFGAHAFIAWQTWLGVLSLGSLVMYLGAVQKGQGQLQSLSASLSGLYQHNLFLSALDDFLELDVSIEAPDSPAQVPRPVREGFALEDVGFEYPSAHERLLEGLSLRIEPGAMVALVGANGSGKTTVVKLLTRLYDPTDGRVTLDGTDLRRFDPAELRREISVVFQDFLPYQVSAHDNVRFGDVRAPDDRAAVERAARRGGVHERLTRLRDGYDTVLGTWFEDGQELSFGEWQKIALARAFYGDPQLVVLDEPTSALDPEAEANLFRAAREMAGERSVLVISHRFSTVRMADEIHVLEDGRITERGSHEELLAEGGRYARLFEIQARGYRPDGKEPGAADETRRGAAG